MTDRVYGAALGYMAHVDVWIEAPAEIDLRGAERVQQAIQKSEHLTLEVRDAITAFRLQLHLDDSLPRLSSDWQ